MGRLSPKRMSFGLAIGPISFATQSRSSFAIFSASLPCGPRLLQHDERAHRFAGEVVRPADHRSFRHQRIGDQRRFDLHRAQAMPGYVEHVVDATHDADVAFEVARRAVAREVVLALEVLRVVALLEALRIAPDGADHRRPRPLDDQDAALAELHRVTGLVDDVGDDARQRQRARTRLQRRRARQRRDQVAAGLGLPPGIDDRAASRGRPSRSTTSMLPD